MVTNETLFSGDRVVSYQRKAAFYSASRFRELGLTQDRTLVRLGTELCCHKS